VAETGAGFGRLLVAVYAVFAISAGARAGVQIVTRLGEAPVAYLLSGFAAGVYMVATVALARRGGGARRVATTAILVELAGVLVIGTSSAVAPSAFPEATVWSYFGRGYGFVPLVLPLVGIWWLRRTARTPGGGLRRAGPGTASAGLRKGTTMGFLDRLLGREPRREQGQPRVGASAARGEPDTQAIERYRYLLRTAPPERIEQAHAEAFERLTPQQRRRVLDELSHDLPPGERPADDSAGSLARAATRAEMRQPGTLERSFGGRGIGMGGVLAGSLLASVAGAFVGTAIAEQLFDESGAGADDGGDLAADDESRYGAFDSGGDSQFGDFGGGDLGGGDFGGGGDF
jgi:hypothetical protein